MGDDAVLRLPSYRDWDRDDELSQRRRRNRDGIPRYEIHPSVRPRVQHTTKSLQPSLSSLYENDFWSSFNTGEGPKEKLDFVLIDPLVSQAWFDSRGQYTASPRSCDGLLDKHPCVVFVVRLPNRCWVLVIVSNHPSSLNPGARAERVVYILNFEVGKQKLPEVKDLVDKLSATRSRPTITYVYPAVWTTWALSSPLLANVHISG